MISPGSASAIIQSVLDSSLDPVLVTDGEGRVLFANRAARKTLLPELQAVRRLDELSPDRLGRFAFAERQAVLEAQPVASVVRFSPVPGSGSWAEEERRTILAAMEATAWRPLAAARRLGISRSTLWRRLKMYGLK
jgi:transcriptional regulator of acetoin/glycerol metabolism